MVGKRIYVRGWGVKKVIPSDRGIGEIEFDGNANLIITEYESLMHTDNIERFKATVYSKAYPGQGTYNIEGHIIGTYNIEDFVANYNKKVSKENEVDTFFN
jgi:hypothetical protein